MNDLLVIRGIIYRHYFCDVAGQVYKDTEANRKKVTQGTNMTWSDRFAAFRRGLIRICAVAVVLTSSILAQNGNTWITMRCLQGDVISLDDTVRFEITVDTRGEDIYGYQIFLTIPEVFTPVLHHTIIDGVVKYAPFIAGNFINVAPFTNKVHEDVGGLYGSGYQYNYGQFGSSGIYEGKGVVASFDLAVTQMPVDPTEVVAIKYDYNNSDGRYTKYARVPLTGEGREEKPFGQAIPDTVQIAGALIYPPIPDTVLTPGSGLDIWLGQHFTSLLDSTDAIWSYDPPYNIPGGSSFNIVDQRPALQTYELQFNTAPTDHDSLDVLIKMQATDPMPPNYTFYDQQNWKVIVDHAPVFDQPLPDTLTTNEDVPITYFPANGALFTDRDDSLAAISVWLEPDSLVHVRYDSVNTVTFYADTNWYGGPLDARLYVQDALGVSADTLLTFTVNPVNDAPIFNLDSLTGGLGDTLVIHHNMDPTVIDLNDFVSDEENDVLLGWTIVSNSDPTSLPTATLTSEGVLTVDASDTSPLPTDVLLVLRVSDNGAPTPETATDTLVVSIRPYPPQITFVGDIKIDATQDPADTTLDLTLWADDLDTPADQLTWAFVAMDAVTEATDATVNITPNNTTMTAVTLTVPTGYSAIDLLEMVVTDDYGYSDTDTARLFIFDDDGPMIFPLPGLTVYRDTTYAGILDLDDYVADLQDDPSNIRWESFGGDSLESFSIDPYHEVTITTNSTFIGNLTVSLVATNSRGLKDTSNLAILVSRRVDGPPLWYAVPDEVEVVYGWTTDLFTYGQVCYDETPTDQIDFTPYHEEDSLIVKVPALTDSVQLTVPPARADDKYTTRLYFSARDDIDSVSYSNTITVNVKDSFSPVWQRIPTISLNIGETYSGLFLWDYVSDRDTDNNDLTIEVDDNDNPYLEVSYDRHERAHRQRQCQNRRQLARYHRYRRQRQHGHYHGARGRIRSR